MSSVDWEHAERAYLIKDLSGDFGRLPMLTRGLARELLVISDRWGVIPLGAESAADVVCRRGGAHIGERRTIRQLLPMLLRDGYIVEHDGALVIRNYLICKYGRRPEQLQHAEQARVRVLAECAARAAEERAISKASHKKKPADAGDPKPADVPPPSSPPTTPVEPPADPPRTPGLHEIAATPPNDSSHGGIPVRAIPGHSDIPLSPPSGSPPAAPADAPPGRKARKPKGQRLTPTADEQSVFDHWVKAMGRTGRTVFADERISPMRARFAAGFTVDDLKRAIDGCAKDPFSMGKNDRNTPFNDLTVICRDAQRVEKFMAIEERSRPRPMRIVPATPPLEPSPVTPEQLEQLREFVRTHKAGHAAR